MNSNVAALAKDSTPANEVKSTAGRRRVLLGFFQPHEAGPYLQALGVTADPASYDAAHTSARTHVAQLGAREEPKLAPFLESAYSRELRAEPTFAEHAANATSLQLGWLELGRLVACQPHLNWDHVERLVKKAPAAGDDDALVRFCLPLQRSLATTPVPANFNPMTNTFSCIVDNPDVRICGQVHGAQPETGRSIVGFSVGPGLSQMSVVSFGGRYMLNNGYHRAAALALAGHERIPVLVGVVPALQFTPAARPGMFSPQIVLGPTPPRITDFMSTAAVDLPSRALRLLFSIHAEVHPIPG